MANITKINVDEIDYKIQGTLYDELGDNTDGAITQSFVTNEFNKFTGKTLNFIKGKYINSAGNLSSNEQWGYIDYIPCANGDVIEFSCGEKISGRYLCLYNENHTKLSYHTNATHNPETLTIENESAAFLRASVSIANASDAYIKINGVEVFRGIDEVKPSFNTIIDISAINNESYSDFSTAITSFPSNLKHGGISFKFINSQTNKYEQYILLSSSWSTDVSDWQGVDTIATEDSNNLVVSNGVVRKSKQISSDFINDIIERKLICDWEDGQYAITPDATTVDVNSKELSSVQPRKCAIVPCVESDVFYIKKAHQLATGRRIWAFIDEPNSEGVANILSKSDLGGISDTEIIAPENSAYLLLNIDPTKDYVIYKGSKIDLSIDETVMPNSKRAVSGAAVADKFGYEIATVSKVLDTSKTSTYLFGSTWLSVSLKAGDTLRFVTSDIPSKATKAYLYFNGQSTRIFEITNVNNEYAVATDVTSLNIAVITTNIQPTYDGSEFSITVCKKGLETNIDDTIKLTNSINVSNLTGLSYTTKTSARNSVPENYRKSGLTITYKLNDELISEQFIGTTWSTDDADWISGSGSGSSSSSVPLVVSNNLFDYREAEARVLNTNGTMKDGDGYWTTGYIAVDENICNKVIISRQAWRVCFYNSNKECLRYEATAANLRKAIDITGTSYLRICFSNPDFDYWKMITYVYYANSSDIFGTFEQLNGAYLSYKDNQYFTVDDIAKFANNKVTGEYTSSFNFIITKGNLGNKNMIITSNAMFINDVDNAVPTVKFRYLYNGATASFSTTEYTIGCKDYYEQKQWRMPPFDHGCYMIVNVTIPENVHLYIRSFENSFSNEINRNCSAYKLDGHKSGNVLSGFTRVSQLGYPTCITIPKLTSDGVWVCFHDETIGSKLKDANGNTPAQNHPELTVSVGIQHLTFAELQTYTYDESYDGRKSKVPTLEEFFNICAKTGMSPMLSVHPTPTTEEYNSLKALAIKCGVLSQLELKPLYGYLQRAFDCFGYSIKSYILQADAYSPEQTKSSLDALNADVSKVRIGFEFWGPEPTTDWLNADLDVFLNAGYIISMATRSGQSFTSEDYMKWMAKGVREFTDDNNPSYGLNW